MRGAPQEPATVAQLVVHGGAGAVPEAERTGRQAAVERALAAGWARLAASALEAVMAAVRHMEDEPLLNAGVGATLNEDGAVELDASVMVGADLRVGACAAVTDVRHPVDLARAVMDDGRHVLLVAEGASRFARGQDLAMCGNAAFITGARRAATRSPDQDTVGAVARDAGGRLAVAVSTGGVNGKLAGRVGDAPLPGCGFYADDSRGAAAGTGQGEAFMQLALCHAAVVEMGGGLGAAEAARAAVELLARRVGGAGGLIAIDSQGRIGAACNTQFMAWAQRQGDPGG